MRKQNDVRNEGRAQGIAVCAAEWVLIILRCWWKNWLYFRFCVKPVAWNQRALLDTVDTACWLVHRPYCQWTNSVHWQKLLWFLIGTHNDVPHTGIKHAKHWKQETCRTRWPRGVTWVRGRLRAGIAGSNPAEGIDVCVVSVVCCKVDVSATSRSPIQRSPTVCVCVCVCVCVIRCNDITSPAST